MIILMKKYIVFVVILATTLGSLSASDWYSADVTLTYQYWNDLKSHSVGLVPQRLRSNLNPVKIKASFFSSQPTFSLAHIKETVIDRLDLNEFVTLRIFNDLDEEITTPEILISSIHGTNLNIIYDPDDNTPEKIQNRRIEWVIEKITGISSSCAWERRADRELIRERLMNNYFNEHGNPKSYKELEKMGREALCR